MKAGIAIAFPLYVGISISFVGVLPVVISISIFCWLWCRAGGSAIDRDERHAQISHLLQESMYLGLVDHRTGQKRVAVVFQRDRQTCEPARQRAAEMAFDP